MLDILKSKTIILFIIMIFSVSLMATPSNMLKEEVNITM